MYCRLVEWEVLEGNALLHAVMQVPRQMEPLPPFTCAFQSSFGVRGFLGADSQC